jgi:phage portal protein BeeE
MKFFGYNVNIAKCGNDKNPFRSLNLNVRDVLNLFGNRSGSIDTSTPEGQAAAFASCSILASIVTKKVSAIANARYWPQDDEGNDIEKPEALNRMQKPNKYQTLSEFVCMVEFFSQIFGKAYIVKIAPVGFENDFELYVVPNLMVTENEQTIIEATFAPYADVKDYTITLGSGYQKIIDKDDMFIVNDATYSLNRMGGAVSRMESLQYPINTFISSYDAVNELLVNRGMLGIISLMSEDPTTTLSSPFTKKDKQELEEGLNKYGVIKGRLKYAITAFKASYVPISSTISDLGLTDIQRNCKKDIAYTYQVPSILLDVEGSTYSNFGEAKLEFYTNDIIPSARNIMSALNRIYGNEGFAIKPFFDHLELFQDAKRQQAAGMVSLVSALDHAVQSGLMSLTDAKNELQKYMI